MKEYFDLIILVIVVVISIFIYLIWLFQAVILSFLVQLSMLTITTLSALAVLTTIGVSCWLVSQVFIWWEDIRQAQIETEARKNVSDIQATEIAMNWAKINLVNAEVKLMESKAKTEGFMVQRIKANERLLIGDGKEFNVVDGKTLMNGNGVSNETALITGEDNEALAFSTGEQWIHDFLFDEYNQLKVFHVKTDGPTGVGKTHLMLHMMWLLQQPHPAAEFWLSDPKFEGDESGWPFEPFVTDFDEVATGAQYLYENVVTARKHAKRAGNPPTHPAFLLFDEADGCYDECKDDFSKPVRRIIKEGRSGWTHCFVAGQSSLTRDAGFSGSLFRNTARLVMGNEALAFLRNAQFSFWDKEYRDKLKKQLMYLQEHNKRYTLAIPPSGHGLPFVAEVPRLDKPEFVNLISPQEKILFKQSSTNGKSTFKEIVSEEFMDPQFLSDVQKVVQNIDKLRYRNGRPVRASICEVLGLPDGGREYGRAKAVAEHLEQVGDDG